MEQWFKDLTDKRLRRSSFTIVNHPIDTIDEWAGHGDSRPSTGIAAPKRHRQTGEGELRSLLPRNLRGNARSSN